MQKVIYYSDEINDDFSEIKRDTVKIEKDFKYINKNPFWNIAAFFVYDVVMRTFAAVYCKINFSIKFVGKEKLKGYKNKGCFLYGNHTLVPGDAFIPNMLMFPKKPYFIVHPDNISLKGTKNLMLMMGAVPLPDNLSGYKSFFSALKQRNDNGNSIVIFPEAHIWPYYTKIRPFKNTSFKYPVKFEKPAFCFTTTYRKRKLFKKPGITVYIDGPFYPDKDIELSEKNKNLRDKIYNTMVKRSENSSFEYIKYIKA